MKAIETRSHGGRSSRPCAPFYFVATFDAASRKVVPGSFLRRRARDLGCASRARWSRQVCRRRITTWVADHRGRDTIATATATATTPTTPTIATPTSAHGSGLADQRTKDE